MLRSVPVALSKPVREWQPRAMAADHSRLALITVALTVALTVPLACDRGTPNDESAEASETADASAGDTSHDSAATETGHDSETGGEVTGCAAEDRDEDFVIGLSKSSPLFTATFVSANPAPPIKDDNTWVMEFTDPGGAPLVDPTIVVIPMMPDHGHGTPVAAVVTATTTAGQYTIDPVNLFMEGLWEITFDVTVAGEQDTVVFKFCVE